MPTDIRSDLYSIGITLWEMLSGELPFQGTAVDLMYQHQHAALPVQKLESTPAPIIALLQILLAKDPGERFQDPAGLQKALIKVKEAIASRSRLTTKELQAVAEKIAKELPKKIPRKHTILWLLAAAFGLAALLLGSFFILRHQELFLTHQSTQGGSIEKSIAVLPFENISPNKDDAYFADGVQDEILNDLAKIAQLKVISRTSVMRYRGDNRYCYYATLLPSAGARMLFDGSTIGCIITTIINVPDSKPSAKQSKKVMAKKSGKPFPTSE